MMCILREVHLAREMKGGFNYGKWAVGRIDLIADYFREEQTNEKTSLLEELYNYAKKEPV